MKDRPVALALLLLAGVTATQAAPATAQSGTPDGGVAKSEPTPFLRVVSDEGRSVALEIAARNFRTQDGGPEIALVGVAHIGEGAYYRALQKLLAECDVVLYESVKPAGTGGPLPGRDDSDADRIDRTRHALAFLAGIAAVHREEHGRYPDDVEALRIGAAKRDARLGNFVDGAMLDAWGRGVRYEVEWYSDGTGDCRFVSWGADGRRGGEGAAADLTSTEGAAAEPLTAGDGDGIQGQLAAALGLRFQLTALDYDQPDWHCSDMSIDQVQREMARRGASFEIMESTLAGSSIPAQIAKFLLGLVRVADAFTNGAMSDTLKVLLIEMLGDESMINASLAQFDEAFAEVIINERNQVVVDDLKRLLATDRDIERIGILYGAGHMRDLSGRLVEQLGYEPGDARWLSAIEVDLTTSPVTERDVRRTRMMVRRMMGQMKAARPSD
ncbi:MAG: hypothetical protein GY715_08920 [Planctomycetes bacterium]|nr:hypothetical protein [Planctomycetota bacterium]